MLGKVSWMSGPTGLVCAAALLGLLLVACEDDSTCPEDQEPDLEVHEWGVMVGCESDTSFFLTSRPEVSIQVDIPVIYVYSESKTPFTAKVTFASGRPIDTYPEGAVSGASATWADVGYADSLHGAPDSLDDFVPLKAIIPVLNDVEANILEYNGVRSRFLFYEGDAKFTNEIDVSYDLDSELVTITNHADYTVFDIIVAITDPCFFGVARRVEAEELRPGQTLISPLDNLSGPHSLVSQLLELGFTQLEAASFNELWRQPFISPNDEAGPANLVYRLSQSEYDKFISLEVTPQPEKVVRALYVLMHF